MGRESFVTTPFARLSDRHLMLRAIDLARNCRSEPRKVSPKVGALVARDGVILGEAYRGELAPGEHAEFTLLERKLPDETLAGATLFTTLEPCTSRNPPKVPCADRVIERRIAKVFIGILDPNPDIRGRGELRLREAGVQIARFDSELMPVIEELNRDFLRQHRPDAKKRRTGAGMTDSVEQWQVGSNGYRIGNEEADAKPEGIPEEESPGYVRDVSIRHASEDTAAQDLVPQVLMPRLPKQFTQRDKDLFLRNGFTVVKRCFQNALEELSRSDQEVEIDFAPVHEFKFVAKIYVRGAIASQCKIWLGGFTATDVVAYSQEQFRIDDDNSYNDTLSVDDDGQTLGFRPSGMWTGSHGYSSASLLTAEQAAEYLWRRFTQALSWTAG